MDVTQFASDFSEMPKQPFETSCVKAIHRVLFPKFPFSKLERAYSFDTGEGFIPFSWYREQVQVSIEWPSIAFIPMDSLWKTNLSELLAPDNLAKSSIYKEWVESGCDVVLTKVIGRFVVFLQSNLPCDSPGIVKYHKGQPYSIMLLQDWLASLGDPHCVFMESEML